LAEQGHAPHVVGVLLVAYAESDGSSIQGEVIYRHAGELDPVHVAAVLVDRPVLEQAELRVAVLPPGGIEPAALATEVAGAGPRTDLGAVDPQRDVGGPMVVPPGDLAADLRGDV